MRRRSIAFGAVLFTTAALVVGSTLIMARRSSDDSEAVPLLAPPQPVDSTGVDSHLRDLVGYCNALPDSDHPQLSLRPLRQLRAALARRPRREASVRAEAGARLELARRLAEAGDLQGALDQLAIVAPPDRDPDPSDSIARGRTAVGKFGRASVHLRAAALLNCTADGDPRYCLVSGGAIVRKRHHAREALRNLEDVLEWRPGDLMARWLVNVAHMRLGTYPHAVPAHWLIAPEAFGSAETVPRFDDVARQVGVATVSLLGASVMEDFDNDGLLDLFTTSYDPCDSGVYYHNDGTGSFSDRSASAGLEHQLGGFNAVQTDYDNDGYLDLFILRGGWQYAYGRQRNSLLRNQGDGTFHDVTHAAGLALPAYPTQTAAWADYDNDGDLDVYVGNEVERPQVPYPSQLFRNDGNGTFTDVTTGAGVSNDRMAKGVTWGDFDNDGDPDLYVSNIGPNRLYRNNGDGTFTDLAPALGVTEPSDRSFATWFWDFDNDGWLDIYVAGYGARLDDIAADYLGRPAAGVRPRLYRNVGGRRFEDVTEAAGLDEVQLPMGANFGDIDNDGWLDIYLGTGDPGLETIVPNVLYRNVAGTRFVDVTYAAGVGHLEKGHGIAFGDIDNDGDQDIYLQAGGFARSDVAPNALFRNSGNTSHWLTIRLIGRQSNRAAIGARLRLVVDQNGAPRSIHAIVSSGGSFGASSLQQEIGLGNASVVSRLEVWWPTSGQRQVFMNVAVDQFIEIDEAVNRLRQVDPPRIQLGFGH